MSYDKGKMTPARPLGDGLWAVDSFRGEPKTYRVNLTERSCDCPHFEHRLAGSGEACKHLAAAETQARWLMASVKARCLTDTEIKKCLQRYHADPIIGGALRAERERRRAIETREAELKALFA